MENHQSALKPRSKSFTLDDVLLNGVASDIVGKPVGLYHVHPCTFTVQGSFQGTVEIHVTNDPRGKDAKAEEILQWPVLKTCTKPDRAVTDGPYLYAAAAFKRRAGHVTAAVAGATDVGHENGYRP